MAKKQSLGIGLDKLFLADNEPADQGNVINLEYDSILPDDKQNRTVFNEEGLKELAESIKTHGIIQPLIVRALPDGKYRLIAGERRFRAAKLAGIDTVPVIVKDVDERDAAEMALIENLQREDLDPIDEANGFEKLINQYNITQEEAASRVGKSRTAVTNALRLLALPESAKNLLRDKVISPGHARALLSLKDADKINDALCVIVYKGLSVRETEALVKGKSLDLKSKAPKAGADEVKQEYLKDLSSKLAITLGRKVSITAEKNGSGKITLEYFDSDDLEELITTLGGADALVE